MHEIMLMSAVRLSTLPQNIGRLRKLKELHVRNNIIKYFPASIQQLKLYTFTGLLLHDARCSFGSALNQCPELHCAIAQRLNLVIL